ncbi:aminodeoxychorismate lyase [Corynebacterium breve]|uniref:Aminodeoxychorismate lyase n=1 Tax=Corynebacterium breve TaxID=3049799 RepID=A0ABY8VGH3_9CORY|nr:aminodeoxychorismate lyase [Corynebacterium breve]WIM67309.1 aminodeoxychorismate lyase [Corynebacterium breve]
MGISQLPPQPVIYIIEPFGGSVRRQNANLPHIFWDDAAVTRGDGVFETVLVRGGRPANLDAHFKRFARSARLLDLPEPKKEQWIDATREAINDFIHDRGISQGKELPDAKCTWTYTRGRQSTGVPTAWLTLRDIDAEVIDQRKRGVKVMTAPRGYSITQDVSEAGKSSESAPWMAVGAKTLNYAANMAALRWAKQHDFDDVIYIDPKTSQVLEGATSTVIVVKKGERLRTPTAGGQVLQGTTQKAIFDYATEKGWRCKMRDVYLDDLLKAESVWLVSSVRMAVRMTRIDDEKMPAPSNEAEIRALINAAMDAKLS